MRFADPQACPDCRGVITGQTTCPQCGLDLASPEVRQLWQTLLHADELLVRATQGRDRLATARRQAAPQAAPPPVTPPQATQPPPVGPTPAPQVPPAAWPPQPHAPATGDPYSSYPRAAQPQFEQAPPKPAKQRQWSVGTILLVLGAFGLIVAGFIFVTQSWGDLGLVGRTLVLTGVTAVFAALGVWVTKRPLRASAEAVWTIVLALLTLDFFAARHEGMLGLDSVSIAWSWVVWGVIALGLGIVISLFARTYVRTDLIAPAVAGGLGITFAGIGAANVPADGSMAWRSILALAVTGVLGLATRPAGLRPLTITARVVVAGFFLWSFVVAAIELFDHPSLDEVVGDGRGLPMALMAVASLAAAWAVRQVRIPAVALAVMAVVVLVATPVGDEWRPEGVWLTVAAFAAALAVAASRGTNDWVRGVRAGATPVVAALMLLHVGLLSDVLEAAGAAIDVAWAGAWDARIDSRWAEDIQPWVVPFVLVALVVVAWFVPRWPELHLDRRRTQSIVTVTSGVCIVDGVVAARLPLWIAVAVLLGAAAILLAAHLRRLAALAGPTSAALVAFAAALAAAHQGVSAATWVVSAVILAVLALSKGPDPLRQTYAVGAVALIVAGVAAGADLADPPHAVPALVAVIASLALIGAAGLWWREHPVRIPVEATAAAAGLVPLVADGSTSELAVRWTIVGVALIALSFVVTGRRWYLWPGAAALVVAYILLIVDSGFAFVEAYTLPLGAVALAVGLYFVSRQSGTSTWLLLGPGLAIALLPSVPQALADPTDLRALLLGLGAVAALALGTRLGWQAPFVLGVVILTLLVLFNIGPYANAAPRVALIAAVGAILLGFGITWEDRVRDGRRLVGYVRAMR